LAIILPQFQVCVRPPKLTAFSTCRSTYDPNHTLTSRSSGALRARRFAHSYSGRLGAGLISQCPALEPGSWAFPSHARCTGEPKPRTCRDNSRLKTSVAAGNRRECEIPCRNNRQRPVSCGFAPNGDKRQFPVDGVGGTAELWRAPRHLARLPAGLAIDDRVFPRSWRLLALWSGPYSLIDWEDPTILET
jgi:hypothetical protein